MTTAPDTHTLCPMRKFPEQTDDQRTEAGPEGSGRPVSTERRRAQRLRLDLETAVPVLISERGCLQWGLARNVSEGGMLIEVSDPPPIGAMIEIQILGVRGSADAPEGVTLCGEVRHNVTWNFGGRDRARLNAIGVRFVSPPPPEMLPPPGSPIH